MGPWAHLVLQGRGGGAAGAFSVYGLLGLLILILDIVVIVAVLRSHKALLTKIVWILVIIFLPVLGLILYFFLGREK